MPSQQNSDNIQQFKQYVAEQKPVLKKHYERLLAQDLSQQNWDGCFQRNLVAVVAQAYQQALAYAHTLAFDASTAPIERGMSQLTQQALSAFDGYVDEFVLFVVDKHRTSCALSNFPDEHKPDKIYLDAVRREIVGHWQQFALELNDYFLPTV